MHVKTAFLGFFVLAGVTVAAMPGSGQRPNVPAAPKSYVILATGNSTAGLTQAVVAAGGTVTADLEKAGVMLARSADAQFAGRIARQRGVQGVTEDARVQWLPDLRSVAAARLVSPSAAANAEPFNAYLWNLRQIGADKTAAAGHLGKGAVVAVIDSAIYTDHQDISPNLDLSRSRSFVPSQPLQQASGFSHATHVSGIIAAPINGVGVQGVAALLVATYGKLNPSQLQSMIETNAADILTPGADDATGHGRLDAARTLGLH